MCGQGKDTCVPVWRDAAGCHCSTAICKVAVSKIHHRAAPKNTAGAFMLLVVSRDAKFSDVAVWDT